MSRRGFLYQTALFLMLAFKHPRHRRQHSYYGTAVYGVNAYG